MTNEQNLRYKKRIGTSGISGQFYETKLISLILLRMLHDDDIEKFLIGTNVDGVGEFDDICFKFKIKHFDKPIAVFLQAKHKEDQKRALVVTKSDLSKHFDSYLKIRNKFSIKSSDVFYKDAYDNVECLFVFYTNTRDELNKIYEETNVIRKINKIIETGDDASQLYYTKDDIKLLCEIILREQIKKLAIVVANMVISKGDNYNNIMNTEIIQTYHVILAQKVFRVSDMETKGYRLGYFTDDNFNTTDEHLLLLRDCLFLEVLKQNKLSSKAIKEHLLLLFSAPTAINISKLIGSVITYKNNKFVFIDKKMNNTDLKELLDRVSVTQSVVSEAIDIAGRLKLSSSTFKVPPTFGNKDLTLRGDDVKKVKRLDYLSKKFSDLIEASTYTYVNNETLIVVNIDENFPDKGFIQLNGGIASAVGNLLILDERTKLLMFNKENNLKGYAKKLLEKINNKLQELDRYRFNVKVQHFPRLVFDCDEHDKNLVIDFTKKSLFCTNQARESQVEKIIKDEMVALQNAKDQFNFQIKCDATFLTYHNEIQKWWMRQSNTEYLTETCNIFQTSKEGFITNPLLSIANVLHKTKIVKYGLKFYTKYVDTLNLNESSPILVVSEIISLSVIKLMQHFKETDCILLDLYYILNLPAEDFRQLDIEMKSNKDKIFILTCNTVLSILNFNREVKNIFRSLEGIKLILIANSESARELTKYFRHTEVKIQYDNIILSDLTEKSQKQLLENSNIIFQGVSMSLSLFLDDDSKLFIKGEHINQIMNGECLVLDQPLTDSNYEEIKYLYLSRKVANKCVCDECEENERNVFTAPTRICAKNKANNLETFYDIDQRTVLITGEPGMGKSSLLTHLSLKTKVIDPKVWIIRINLLDYSRYFFQWKNTKTNIDILEALKFICLVLVNGKQNDILSKDKIILKHRNCEICFDSGTEVNNTRICFIINMFLHYYNRNKIIFLFDGFDEICPLYEKDVTTFYKVIKDNSRVHRIWVTCRSYNKILNGLIVEFGDPYLLLPFSSIEQEIFVERFLQTKLNLNELNRDQINKIDTFITFIKLSHFRLEKQQYRTLYKYQTLPLNTVYLYAIQYFKTEIKRSLYIEDKDKYIKAWDLNVYDMKFVRQYNGGNLATIDMNKFITIPLHIYMVAGYFQNEIINTEKDTVWDLNVDFFAMYERFIETKLKKIRFEDKNRMDLYRPDVYFTFAREHKEFVNKHKKLAAYALFSNVHKLFNESEFKYVKETINLIDIGEEKTGLVYDIVLGVPRFVHLTIAEYFAVEYVCDFLKNAQCNTHINALWDFILNDMFFENNVGVLNILDDKLVMDLEIKERVNSAKCRRIILDLLLKQSTDRVQHAINRSTLERIYVGTKMFSALEKGLSENVRNLTSLFLSTFEFVNKDNLNNLIEIIVKANLMRVADINGNQDFTSVVYKTVISIDESKVSELYPKSVRSNPT